MSKQAELQPGLIRLRQEIQLQLLLEYFNGEPVVLGYKQRGCLEYMADVELPNTPDSVREKIVEFINMNS